MTLEGDPEFVEVQDWFVPVVYTNGTEFYSRLRQRTDSGTRRFVARLRFHWEYFAFLAFWSSLFVFWVCEPFHDPSYRLSWKAGIFSPAASILMLFAIQLYRAHRSKVFTALRNNFKERKSMLRVEGDLTRAKVVFVYHRNIRNTVIPLVKNLSELWLRTKFVETRLRLNAEWFIDTGGIRSLKHTWQIWFNAGRLLDENAERSFSGLWKSWRFNINEEEQEVERPNPGANAMTDAVVPGRRRRRAVLIIENLQTLYPEKVDKRYSDAQARFERWIEHHFNVHESCASPGTDDQNRQHKASRYLVLIGESKLSKELTRQWFTQNVDKGQCQTLKRTALRAFVNLGGQDHHVEW